MFASKTLTEHFARGAAGIGALAGAVVLAPEHPWLAAPLVPIALIALRGCPTCWTMGLVQTIVARLRGQSQPGACERCTRAMAPTSNEAPQER